MVGRVARSRSLRAVACSCVAAAAIAGCGHGGSGAPDSRVTPVAAASAGHGRCRAASHYDATYGVCRPDRAGPAHAQRSEGGLRFVRAPLLQLFADGVIWADYRLNRKPTGYVTTFLDDTEVIPSNGVGYDDADKVHHCFGIVLDQYERQTGRSLRHPHVGQRITLKILAAGHPEGSATTVVRARASLPRDTTDIGGWGWFEALGCKSGITPP